MAISRFGLTSKEFYQLTPLEFQLALEDHEKVYFNPVKLVCETIRQLAVIVHNSAFGRKRKDQIQDPKKLIRFSWERPKVQTVDQMKAIVLGLAHHKGVKVTQKGKRVEE